MGTPKTKKKLSKKTTKKLKTDYSLEEYLRLDEKEKVKVSSVWYFSKFCNNGVKCQT